MTLVWDSAALDDAGGLFVALCLADHANDAGVCWPSKRRLAARCRCTPRHVQSVLARLELAGALTIDRAGDGRRPNWYKLNPEFFERAGALVPPSDASEVRGPADAPPHAGDGTADEPPPPPTPAPPPTGAPALDEHPAVLEYRKRRPRVEPYFAAAIAARVGTDPARLAAWRDLLAVWAATADPSHVGKPYNLGNVPRLLDALDEAAPGGRIVQGAAAGSPLEDDVLPDFIAIAEATDLGLPAAMYLPVDGDATRRRRPAEAVRLIATTRK